MKNELTTPLKILTTLYSMSERDGHFRSPYYVNSKLLSDKEIPNNIKLVIGQFITTENFVNKPKIRKFNDLDGQHIVIKGKNKYRYLKIEFITIPTTLTKV